MIKLELEFHNLTENPNDLPTEKSLWCYVIDSKGFHHVCIWLNFPEHHLHAAFYENGNYFCGKVILWSPAPKLFIPGADENIEAREQFYEDDI